MGFGVSLWQLLHAASGLWGLALLLPFYLLALIRGDPLGRGLVQAVAVSAALGTLLAVSSKADGLQLPFYNEQVGIDLLFLAIITLLALRSPRFYPLIIAALQLLIAITGALVFADLISGSDAHAIMRVSLEMAQLAVLAFGVFAHRRRSPWRARVDFHDSHLAPRANRAR